MKRRAWRRRIGTTRTSRRTKVMREVAAAQGWALPMFTATEAAMASGSGDLTINGCHLNEADTRCSRGLFAKTFGQAPAVRSRCARR